MNQLNQPAGLTESFEFEPARPESAESVLNVLNLLLERLPSDQTLEDSPDTDGDESFAESFAESLEPQVTQQR